jgi:hypothetical protein
MSTANDLNRLVNAIRAIMDSRASDASLKNALAIALYVERTYCLPGEVEESEEDFSAAANKVKRADKAAKGTQDCW